MSDKNYRVLFVPNIDQPEVEYTEEFVNLETAKAALNSIANYTLMLHKTSIMPDFNNCGWVEVFQGGEWEEIEDNDRMVW